MDITMAMAEDNHSMHGAVINVKHGRLGRIRENIIVGYAPSRML